MKQEVVKATTSAPVGLNLNLRIFGFFGLILIFLYSILGRGLYFRPDLLIGLIIISFIFILAIADAALRGETNFGCYPIDYLVLLMPVMYFISVFQAASRPDAVLGVLKNLGYVMVYFAGSQVIRSWRNYRQMLELIYTGGIIVSAIGALAATGALKYPGAFRENSILSTFQYENALAVFLAVATVIGLSLWFMAEKSPFREMWYSGGLVLINVVLLATKSRAVWVMYPVILLIWILGLPAARRSQFFLRISYVLIASVMVNRAFMARIATGNGEPAQMLLIGGLLVAVAGWLAIYRFNRLVRIRPMAPAVRQFWQVVGILYLTVMLGIYAFYTVNSLPGSWAVSQQLDSVSSYDSSFTQRFSYYRDALKIVKDYPLLGTGAGGWSALYRAYQSEPYNSAEVHNGFLQVLVETGIPGFLVYAAIWGLAGYSFYRLVKYFRSDEHWPLVWGTGTSLTALGLHSFFDFDLSLPTLAILTYILLSLVRNGRVLAHGSSPAIQLNGWRLWTLFCGGLILAAILAIPSHSFYSAGRLGAEGARAMTEQKLPLAENKFRAAMAMDRFSASYEADLAKLNLFQWMQKGDRERLKQAIICAEAAAKKEPYSIPVNATLITTYLMAGLTDDGIATAEKMVKANRLEVMAYEIMAGTCIDGAVYYKNKGQLAKALVLVQKVQSIPNRLEKNREEVFKVSGKAYKYEKFGLPTPKIELSVGKAYLLSGDTGKAIPHLERAMKFAQTEKQAAPWLCAAYKLAGDSARYNEIYALSAKKDSRFKPLFDVVEKILRR